MPSKFKIEAKGFGAWEGADQVIFDAVKDAMDDIRDDFVSTSESLAPKKSGKLEKSHYARRYYKNLQVCYFTVSYKATNPKDGFDYAKWTHDENYNLGAGSRSKRPARSRFARGSLKVGTGYMAQVKEASEDQWEDYIGSNVRRKLDYSLKVKSKK